MKKLLLTIAVALATLAVNAQECTWGIKGGVDLTYYGMKLDGLRDRKIDTDDKVGFYLGAVNTLTFNDRWGVQTELFYSYGGIELGVEENKVPNKEAELTYNTHSLRLPVLAKFHLAEGFHILAGPYVSYRVAGKVKFSDSLKEVSGADVPEDKVNDFFNDNLRKLDVGVMLGLEFAFDNGVFVEARYSRSFLNKIKEDVNFSMFDENIGTINLKDAFGFQPKARYNSILLGIGYRF